MSKVAIEDSGLVCRVDVGTRRACARLVVHGPFGTIDHNAPGGVRDCAERYRTIYSGIFASTQRRDDWNGPAMDEVEANRRRRLPADELAERKSCAISG